MAPCVAVMPCVAVVLRLTSPLPTGRPAMMRPRALHGAATALAVGVRAGRHALRAQQLLFAVSQQQAAAAGRPLPGARCLPAARARARWAGWAGLPPGRCRRLPLLQSLRKRCARPRAGRHLHSAGRPHGALRVCAAQSSCLASGAAPQCAPPAGLLPGRGLHPGQAHRRGPAQARGGRAHPGGQHGSVRRAARTGWVVCCEGVIDGGTRRQGRGGQHR